MLSHQPEVSRLLHNEHVQRLAADAQQPMQVPRLPSQRASQLRSRLAAAASAAADVRNRRLSTRA